ncbi:YkuS family protein [Evansella halocellulosilytica]|uniref:YkuS family protein n=1 Tax=Evansella halocellulosilytica TaxID=2011013 RepID=UPI000BB9136C|nr:YkuS family protein [Evansella halocellulosilytica]
MARIGVEQSLSDVQQELQARGHEIVQLQQEQDAEGCDCCVITGQDQNVMGEQQTAIEGAVINAHGLTAEEVCQQVESRVNPQQ